ncbi:MAG TPA: hypothetical protein ACFE0H_11425 [Elainellaceae cyanobacterium]
MAGESKTTTDHNTIKQWVESRGGHPATVKATGDTDDPGVLQIDFPGYGDEESLEHIPWDAFFEKFEDKQLAFLYQDRLDSGEESRFFKFVSRND